MNDDVFVNDSAFNGRILMHVCCGPCSLFCIDAMREAFPGAELRELYANPNIHPYGEFLRRAESSALAAEYKGVEIDFLPDYDLGTWKYFECSDGTEQIQGEPSSERCAMCYRTRMELTGKYAAAHGFDAITSTLFVSPYQDHELLKEVCAGTAEKYGLRFAYVDFRTGFRQGQKEAKEIGLYRQKYCGCIRSLRENKGR